MSLRGDVELRSGYERVVALVWLGSTIFGRVLPYVGSGLLHGAVFASVAFRPAPAHMEASASERVVAIDAFDEPVPPDALKRDVSVSPAPAPAREAVPQRGHRHPYPVPSSHDARPHDPAVDHREIASGVPVRESNASPMPNVVTSPIAEDARFTIRVAPSIASPASGQKGSGGASETAAIVPEAAVSAPARLLASSAASYPAEARANDVEADVSLEIVVDTHGVVIEARPLSHTGFGFDEAALSAIRRYRFSSAQKDGHPVRVRMRWSVQFRLR